MINQKLLEFLLLTAGMYASYICYSIYQQKIFSHTYINQDGTSSKFVYASATTLFPALCCCIIGTIRKGKSSSEAAKLPIKEQLILGGLYFLLKYTYNAALVYISYPTQLILGNLRIIAIYIIGQFFSRVVQKTKSSSSSKLFLGFFMSIGIFLFNYQGIQKSSNQTDYTWGIILLIICILAQGFLVDSQTYNKKVYQPSSNDLFLYTNKITFIIAFGYSLILGQLREILKFIVEYESFGMDLLLLSVCGTIGQFFVYEIIKKFQPRLHSLLTVFRKILNVFISLLVYGHEVSMIQIAGMAIVFSGLLYQISSQFKVKKQKQKGC